MSYSELLKTLFDYLVSDEKRINTIRNAIKSKQFYSMDIGPISQGGLGFWFYDVYDSVNKPECCIDEVRIEVFSESYNIKQDEFIDYAKTRISHL